MTITADEFERSDRDGIVRWIGSLLIILALHAGLLLIITLRQLRTEPIGMPPAAVMIDLAPLPAPPPTKPSVVPPPPEPQVQTPPLEQQTEPLPLPGPELPKLVPSPAPHPAVTLPAPEPPKPKPKVKRAEPPPQPQPQTAPLAPPAPSAPATTPQIPTNSSPAARASWQAQLVAWLEKYKRYPRVAQEQRQQGVVHLRFTIDREGKVLASEINKSSGFELLDDEVLALIQRAQPVPAPPPEVAGNRIELLVPVSFSLHKGGQ
jgi:periplasmic protein TonB